MKKIVHVVGTGTIGEPLIGLFADFQKKLGIDEITFHKRLPCRRSLEGPPPDGARRQARRRLRSKGRLQLGHKVAYETREAFSRATVVIRLHPAGNENEEGLRDQLSGPRGFLAQGSEFGFGKPYARGINDGRSAPGQIASCRSSRATRTTQHHADQDPLRTMGRDLALERGRFVCMRRANDVSQDQKASLRPARGQTRRHPIYGTHHARAVSLHVFATLG